MLIIGFGFAGVHSKNANVDGIPLVVNNGTNRMSVLVCSSGILWFLAFEKAFHFV